MDRNTAKMARKALQTLVDAGIDGFDIEIGNGSFGHSEVTFKVVLRDKGAVPAGQQMAERMAKMVGFEMANAKGDAVVEYRAKSPKFPWIVKKAADGRLYKYSDEHMKMCGFGAGV